MNVKVLQRLAALENRIADRENPSTIMIFYDEEKAGYVVREDYGHKQGEYHSKKIFVKRLGDYIFKENYDCPVILETMAAPEPPNDMWAFKVGEMRKGCGIGKNDAFSINKLTEDPDGKNQAGFEVITYERK